MELSSNWKKFQAVQGMAPPASVPNPPPILGKRKAIVIERESNGSEGPPRKRTLTEVQQARRQRKIQKRAARRAKPADTETAEDAVVSVTGPPLADAPRPRTGFTALVADVPAPSPGPAAPAIPPKVGKHLAIDCEMLQTTSSHKTLGRVSIVDYESRILLDTYVQPPPGSIVVDYRTRYSGLSPSLVSAGMPFADAREKVLEIVKGKILIGHSIGNEFAALEISHPRKMCRDTQQARVYRLLAGRKAPSLKLLAQQALGLEIQVGAHSSVEDARATMLLYRQHRAEIEQEQG